MDVGIGTVWRIVQSIGAITKSLSLSQSRPSLSDTDGRLDTISLARKCCQRRTHRLVDAGWRDTNRKGGTLTTTISPMAVTLSIGEDRGTAQMKAKFDHGPDIFPLTRLTGEGGRGRLRNRKFHC